MKRERLPDGEKRIQNRNLLPKTSKTQPTREKWFIMPSKICASNKIGVSSGKHVRQFKSHTITSQWIIIVWLLAAFQTSSNHLVNGLEELHIGGIFPIAGKGGWQGGQACLPAAELALDDVNSKSDLLPGFKLTLYSNDSEVSPIISTFLLLASAYI